MDLLKYVHTVKHLKPIQIKYQIWYRLRKIIRSKTGFKYSLSIEKEGKALNLVPDITKYTSYEKGTFYFLNREKDFEGNIDWNYNKYGKLWTYNLNYFDFLNQEQLESKTGLKLIDDFISKLNQQSMGLEPYPIALRSINWVKFLSQHSFFTPRESAAPAARNKQDNSPRSPRVSAAFSARKKIDASLYAQYQILLANLEYHLLANHLLENGFSLLFGAFYFRDETLYSKAKKIITDQLQEQILNDGGHFELSPMYHQIILDRLLDSINLVQNNYRFDSQERLLNQMQDKAQKMLNWLNQMTFSNGQIPLLNDAAPGIAPPTHQLNDYATRLNLMSENSSNPWTLYESGYRRYNGTNYECILDIGHIGPSYQPGHAHADTFNCVLNVKNEPILVDTGISTYDTGKTRLTERGTSAHNTVTVQDKNSSEVWSSFRVARRAKVKIIKEKRKNIVACHDGYKRIGTFHRREWCFSENQIKVNDTLTGKLVEGIAHFWLAPGLAPILEANEVKVNSVLISFHNSTHINLIPTKIPHGYNRFLDSYKIEIMFKHHLNTIITTS